MVSLLYRLDLCEVEVLRLISQIDLHFLLMYTHVHTYTRTHTHTQGKEHCLIKQHYKDKEMESINETVYGNYGMHPEALSLTPLFSLLFCPLYSLIIYSHSTSAYCVDEVNDHELISRRPSHRHHGVLWQSPTHTSGCQGCVSLSI